ncbi:unnamed protein product [Leptidea sinapis]|uniref:Lipase domain-containing protein n=1 Tax=Leptidea sinapis TaxID=189913 RepID=A0A5E4PU42_9NEOP|nr:unnamed protein product [Leptidea sinapis]
MEKLLKGFYPDGILMEHVSEKDAEFVDIIHTDAGAYGAPVRTGTADFWPNGGKSSLAILVVLCRVNKKPSSFSSIACRLRSRIILSNDECSITFRKRNRRNLL